MAAFGCQQRDAIGMSRSCETLLGGLMALLNSVKSGQVVLLACDNHQTPGRVLVRVLRDYRLGALKMIVLYFTSAIRIALEARRARRQGLAAMGTTMASPAAVLGRLYVDRMLLAFLLPLIFVLGLVGVFSPSSVPALCVVHAGSCVCKYVT